MSFLTLFLRLTNIFVSACPGNVAIGLLKNQSLDKNMTMVFDLLLLRDLYSAIVKILKLFQLENEKFIEKSENIGSFHDQIYSWKMSSANEVTLLLKKEEKIELTMQLNYPQFNELIYALYKSTILSLCLSNFESEFCLYVIENEISDLVQWNDYNKFKSFVETTSYKNESFKLFTVFTFYQDIIFMMYKLNKLCNKNILPNRIIPLLDEQ